MKRSRETPARRRHWWSTLISMARATWRGIGAADARLEITRETPTLEEVQLLAEQLTPDHTEAFVNAFYERWDRHINRLFRQSFANHDTPHSRKGDSPLF